MFIKDFEALKLWLTESLAPICDADPIALAKYVLALMKKDKSIEELQRVCIQQLDVFLQEHTKTFVSNLFDVIVSEKYIVKSSGEEKDLTALLQVNSSHTDLKEENKNGERRQSSRGSPSVKRRRSSSPLLKDAYLSGNGVGWSHLSRDIEANSLSVNPVLHQIDDELANKKNSATFAVDRDYRKMARCRDFHEKGFCMRGELCSYDHGSDPVVVENHSLSKVMGYPVPNQLPLLNVPYVPQSMPVSQTQAFVDPIANRNYNAISVSQRTVLTVPIIDDEACVNHSEQQRSKPKVDILQPNSQPSGGSALCNNQEKVRGASSHRYGGGNSKPRGGTSGNRFDPQNCTLYVTRIPHALNNVGKLYEQFSKFGNIANVQVNPSNEIDTALITFNSHQEALAAYRSPEPIFSNRFVRLFFFDHTRSAASQHQQQAHNNPRAKPSHVPHPSTGQTEESQSVKLVQQQSSNSNGSSTTRTNVFTVNSSQECRPREDDALGALLDSSDGEIDEAAKDSVRRRPRILSSSQKGEGEEKSMTAKSLTKSTSGIVEDRTSQPSMTKNNVRQAAHHQQQQQQRLKKELHVKQLSLLQGYRKQMTALVMKLEKASSIVDKRRIAAAVKNVNNKVSELERELKVSTSKTSPSSELLQRQLLDLEMEIHQKELSNECVVALKARLLQLKRTINSPSTNAVSRRRLSSNGSAAGPNAAPPRLPMASQTRLDKRPRTLYITGHDEDQYDVLMTELAVSGLRITTYKQMVMEGTPVAIVTFGSRAEAEQALIQFQIFQGRTLKLEWTRPKLESSLDGLTVVESSYLEEDCAYGCVDSNDSTKQKGSAFFSEMDALESLSSPS